MVLLSMLMGAGVGAVTDAELHPNNQYSYTGWSTKLREHLLSGYDSAVPPTSNRSSPGNFNIDADKFPDLVDPTNKDSYITHGSLAGTDVGMQIVFYKIDAVDVPNGHMRVKCWLRMGWYDYRLRWDPADFGNITYTLFRGASYTLPEDTEIWLPDVSCNNAQTGLMNSFDPALASVTSDGWVYWSRPGMLEVICRYSGLINFPSDHLKCKFEMGGWWLAASYEGLYPMGTPAGYDLAEKWTGNPATKYSYNEQVIEAVNVTRWTAVYGSDQAKGYPTMVYTVSLKRQTFFYLNFVLLPSVVFSLISFAVFFMSFEVGERLGFGITLVLVVEVAKQTMSALLPICGELLWMELFFWVNFLFTCFSLVESCIVLGLAFNTEEYFVDLITPAWVRPVRAWVYSRVWMRMRRSWLDKALGYLGVELEKEKEEGVVVQLESAAGKHLRNKTAASRRQSFADPNGEEMRPLGRPSESIRSGDRVRASTDAGHETRHGSDRISRPEGWKPKLMPVSASAQQTGEPEGWRNTRPEQTEEEDEAQKLLYFESLFFKMDPDGDGTITFEEAGRLLAFTALGMSSEERNQRLRDADDGDGTLDREEFIGLCVDNLWDTPRPTLEMAADNFSEFSKMKDNRISAKWRRVANNVDRFCRVWVPIGYLTCLLIIYSLKFDDKYDDPEQKMFSILGTEETNIVGVRDQASDWHMLPTEKKVYKPDITMQAPSQLVELIKFGLIIFSFFVSFYFVVAILVHVWSKLTAIFYRKFDEAKAAIDEAMRSTPTPLVRNTVRKVGPVGDSPRLITRPATNANV